MVLILIGMSAQASKTIIVNWPFGIGDRGGQYIQHILTRANEQQKKYNFVLVSVQGGGGTIAATATLSSKKPTLLAHSMSYFIRPHVYPDTAGYTFDQFETALPVVSSPFAVMSRRGFDPSQGGSIAVVGIGTSTHLLALEIQKKYPKIVIVAYKSLTDAAKDFRGGHVDMTIDFAQEVNKYSNVQVLGTTGTRYIKNYPRLMDQYPDSTAFLSVSHFILNPTGMPEAAEIRQILYNANINNDSLQQLFNEDHAQAYDILIQDYNSWYRQSINRIKALTQNIHIQ